VWDAARTENQRAGRGADGLIADQRSDLALQDVEALVLVAMDVARRAIALLVSASISANRPFVWSPVARKVSSQPLYQNESWRDARPRPNGASRSASAVVLRGVVMVGSVR
jgi:hypothetical protein